MNPIARFTGKRWITVAMSFGTATVIALLFAGEIFFQARTGHMRLSGRLYWELSGWYAWAALLPLILRIVRKYPLERTRPARLVLVHLPAGLAVGAAQFGIQTGIARLYDFVPEPPFLYFLSWRLIVYLQIIVVCYALEYARRGKEEEIKASKLKAKIAELQLQALKTQLRPAFLLDTLNSLSGLVQKDVEEADNTIALIGDFLRMTLENSSAKEIPIRTELAFLNCYLKIEQIFLPNRLRIHYDVDSTYLDAVIPNLLLQPIVECAIYNKKQLVSAPIHITLRIRSSNGFLEIQVQENSGAYGEKRHSIEDPRLTNIGARLQETYGNDYEFRFRIAAQKGLEAQVRLPIHFRENESRGAQHWTDLIHSTDEDAGPEIGEGELLLPDHPGFRKNSTRPVERTRGWMAVLGIWTAVNLYFLGRNILLSTVQSEPVNWAEIGWITFAWYLWAVLTWPAVRLANRFPLERPHLIARLFLHFGMGVVFWFALCIVFSFGMFILKGEKSFADYLLEGVRSYGFALDLLIYWTILAISHAVRHYRNHQFRRMTAGRLEFDLLESQIQALHMQLHPHFLFNTLHSISELIHEDISAARQMLERLSRFLKLTLENSGTQQVPLEKELEFLECYLEIQQVRFQDRLKVRMSIDERTRKLLVPNLVLQPIVENAIRYGIAPRTDSGLLQISAERKNGTLHLQVTDDGPGLSGQTFKEGLGLSNTRARLQQLYGKSQRMRLQNAPGGGLMVTLEIPVQT